MTTTCPYDPPQQAPPGPLAGPAPLRVSRPDDPAGRPGPRRLRPRRRTGRRLRPEQDRGHDPLLQGTHDHRPRRRPPRQTNLDRPDEERDPAGGVRVEGFADPGVTCVPTPRAPSGLLTSV